MTDAMTPSAVGTVTAVMMGRRTVKQFLAQPVARETLQQLIDVAVWAPNHRINEPWRFYVLGDGARTELARIAGAITERKILAAGGETAVAQRKGAEAGTAWRSVPTLLVLLTPSQPPRHREGDRSSSPARGGVGRGGWLSSYPCCI